MAILDELFVRLGFDGSAFTVGTKKAEESLGKVNESISKSGKNIVDMGKKGEDAFAGFRREALGALALFTGGASIAKFTGDMAKANTALGNLSKQLDIAPQKLTQLHEAMKAAGGNASDIDTLYTSVQNKFANPAERAHLMNLSAYLGIDPVDQKTGHVHSDLLDQIAHSKVFKSSSRAVQDNYIQQLGGPASLNNLVSRKDYDTLMKRFTNLGPTTGQIKQGEQLLSDWTELKANTNKISQQLFSDIEPTIDKFIKSLIDLEKAHPKEIADGLAALAVALTTISAILTAKSFLSVLSKIGAIGGGAAVAKEVGAKTAGKAGLGSRLLLAGAAIDLFASHPVKGNDKKAIQEGNDYEALVQHYKKRTGAWTALDFDEEKEREIVKKEQPPKTDASPISTNNLDLNRLVGAVAMQESGGNPYAVSKAGAQGMMQFMPATAREQGITDPFDAQQSWNAGRNYLQKLLNKFHSVDKALAAYNWGQGNIAKNIRLYGDNWKAYLPKETSNYLARVNHNYETGHVVHNNNNNTNNVTVAINGEGKKAHDLAREIAHALPQQTSGHAASRVL